MTKTTNSYCNTEQVSYTDAIVVTELSAMPTLVLRYHKCAMSQAFRGNENCKLGVLLDLTKSDRACKIKTKSNAALKALF